MGKSQEQSCLDQDLLLHTERLGPLPLINFFLEQLELENRIERFVPTSDKRVLLPYAKGIGVLLRSILVEREPIYRQYETISTFAHDAFGLDDKIVNHTSDDAIGRALDHLFDADRASLVTDVVVATVKKFGVALDELHNDSTTIKFCGKYPSARGRKIRGKRAPFITYGYSKDHRPDLKQMLFIMTTSNDGAVPVQFRSDDGNCNDSKTHEENWDALCQAAGCSDFLYVADSKLCNREAMDHIDRRGGRFVTVIPRSRREDSEFREWIQSHEPEWELVYDLRNPRRRHGPRDRWWVFRYPIPSREGWPVTWVNSSLLALHQEQTRRERLTRAIQELEDLHAKLTGPRPRKRKRLEIQEAIDKILKTRKVGRYLVVKIIKEQEHQYRQATPGRPGPNTRYIRKTRKRWGLRWVVDDEKIAYDRKSDGMYPLLTNDRNLTDKQILDAHKRQPSVEKRFEQTKTVFEIAPVLLKNEGRVEALFFVYFLALLVQALIERQLRLAMKKHNIEKLPMYPEERTTHRPTAEQIFRLFGLVQRNTLFYRDEKIHHFKIAFSDLQKQVLSLLDVPEDVYGLRSQK